MADEKLKLFSMSTLFAISEITTVEFKDFWNIIYSYGAIPLAPKFMKSISPLLLSS